MFVPVINLHVSNLHSTESRIIKVYLFFLQSISKCREFIGFSDSDKKKKCPLFMFIYMSLYCDMGVLCACVCTSLGV